MENETLVQQARSNSKEHFSNSPGLRNALMHAFMDALNARHLMNTQVLGSERGSDDLKDICWGRPNCTGHLGARSF